MFEAQSRGRPKLVYARAGSSDVDRNQTGDMSSYVRNLVARMAQEDINNNQQPLKPKQLSDIGIQSNSLQTNRHSCNTNPSLQSNSLQINRHGCNTTSSLDRDTYLLKAKVTDLKVADLACSIEKKKSSENDISPRKESLSVLLKPRTVDKLTESYKKHLQPSSVVNQDVTPLQIEIVELPADEKGDLNTFGKSARDTRLGNTLARPPVPPGEIFKSVGSNSKTSRVETISLMPVASNNVKPTGPPSVVMPAEKLLTVAAIVEKVNSSSNPSTEKTVRLLSNSRSAHNTTSTASVGNTERVSSSLQTSKARAGKIEPTFSLSKATTVTGKTETTSSLAKATTVDRVTAISSNLSSASRGKFETNSTLAKTTAEEAAIPISSASTYLTSGTTDRAALLSKATAAEKTTPSLSNSTAVVKEKLLTATPQKKSSERSAQLSSACITAATGKSETAPSLLFSTIAEKFKKLNAESTDRASNISNVNIDRSSSSGLKQFTLTPKQIYSSSATPISNFTTQQKSLALNPEQPTVSHAQSQVNEVQSQQTNHSQLHATTIQVHPQHRQQTSVGQSSSSDLPLNSSQSPNYNRFQSQPMSSSMRISETPPLIDVNGQDSEFTSTSSDSCLPIASSSPPKSILKSTTSCDKGDTVLISGNHNEESVDYCDFSYQKTESFSVKKQVHSFFKTKICSPPPQLKRHVTIDMNTTNPELTTDGKLLKKSVTFNSEVRLHLDNDESTTDALSADD